MRKIVLGVVLALVATPAIARDGQVYAGLDGGIIISSDYDVTDSTDTDIADGYDIDGLVGYDLGLFRVEAEAAYKRVTTNDTQVGGLGAGGHASAISGMVNGLVELGDDNIYAYAGGGVGYASVDLNPNGAIFFDEDSDSGFAWQILTGLRVQVTDTIDLGVKYRYFRVDSLDFVDDHHHSADGDVRTHSVMAGVTFNFGRSKPLPAPPVALPPPPPPPPPPPIPPPPPLGPALPERPPCERGPYIVFFDWDESAITREAAATLDVVVNAYGACTHVPVVLAGYADRSGSDQYNIALSGRRNEAVERYLEAKGVPPLAIESEAFGETKPRVPTADGVRELQNRRVEIKHGTPSGW